MKNGIELDSVEFQRRARVFSAQILAGGARDIIDPPKTSEADIARRKAINWFKSELEGPGTFRWCCEILHISPARIRRVLFEDRQKINTKLLQNF